MSYRDDTYEPLLIRHPSNPILTSAQWPYPASAVFNPGAIRLQDGRTLLLCRVEDHKGHSHLCSAISNDGVSEWEIDKQPTLRPDPDNYPEEIWGVEDARIMWIPEFKKYSITYTSYSRGGPGVSLALTEDFRSFERYGVIMSPEDKDAALLPHRVGGHWAIIHRPMTVFGGDIWISYSPDLRHWGSHKMILEARRGAWWDAGKIGLSPPPIETSEGWMLMYHGVRTTSHGPIYRLGLALFDKETPERCRLRSDEWFFAPQADYERFGDVNDVVFPCGFTVGPDGDTLNVYYGAADCCIALATGSIRQLLDWLMKNGRPPAADPTRM